MVHQCLLIKLHTMAELVKQRLYASSFRLMAQLSVSSPPSSAVSFNSDSDDIITDLSYSKER